MNKKFIIFLVFIFSFISNILWSFLGLLLWIIHIPYSLKMSNSPLALIMRVQNTNLLDRVPGYKNWRWIALGNIAILNHREENWDEDHELVHVAQFMRYPGIFPFLNILETSKYWYRNNKFEIEAYNKAKNRYHP